MCKPAVIRERTFVVEYFQSVSRAQSCKFQEFYARQNLPVLAGFFVTAIGLFRGARVYRLKNGRSCQRDFNEQDPQQRLGANTP